MREIFLVVLLNTGLFAGICGLIEWQRSQRASEQAEPERAANESLAEETSEEPAREPEEIDEAAVRALLERELLGPLALLQKTEQIYDMMSRARPRWAGAWDCTFAIRLDRADGSAVFGALDVFHLGQDGETGPLARSIPLSIADGRIEVDDPAYPVFAWLEGLKHDPSVLGVYREWKLILAPPDGSALSLSGQSP